MSEFRWKREDPEPLVNIERLTEGPTHKGTCSVFDKEYRDGIAKPCNCGAIKPGHCQFGRYQPIKVTTPDEEDEGPR